MEELKTMRKGTTFVDGFSKEIYEQTYKFGDEDKDINGTHKRVADNLASIEENPAYWSEKFLDALEDFKFVPGGRITSNAGTGLKGTTYINCFVDGFIGEDQDSMEGILDTLKRQALILKSEGGYGFCADTMRPRGAYIRGIGNESPGAVEMLSMWDTQSAVITAGSGRKSKRGKTKIRKGAQMVTMSVWHPDIEEFITAKQTPGRLTKFNMSLLVSDEFMEATKTNSPWKLEFPDYEVHNKEYKKDWDGNLGKWKEAGLGTIVYKEYENANTLWDLIMESTYNRNEPGILFSDTINEKNNLYYEEYISATNPCGEQLLPIGGVCLLGSLNLTQFVNTNHNDWDYYKLAEIIPTAIRFMDNVNDVTNVPLESQKKNLKDKRRIGLGIMGYGSALMMMKLRYGSDKAVELTETLMKFIMNAAYSASALIAKEKGAFLLYDEEKYLNGEFIKELDEATKDLIRKYGIRNSHLLSIQPTGNTSIFANVISGGLEPVFMPEYDRTSMMPYAPEGLSVPKNVDWTNKTFKSDSEWKWIKEGDENLLSIQFDGSTWKFDNSRGLLRVTTVKDYAVRFLEQTNEWDSNADWAATTTELGIEEHVVTMGVLSKYIDSAMSKTVNIPNDYPYESFKNLYQDLHATKTVKGGTTYRAGTMTEVLAATKTNGNTENVVSSIIKTQAPPRGKSLKCDIHHVTAKGHNWIVIIGLMGDDPYEVFAFKPKAIHLPKSIQDGTLTKVKRGHYNLECTSGLTIENVADNFETDEQEALTRLISTALRHGTPIQFIFEQLNKAEGNITSFSKAIGRTLKRYLSDDLVSTDSCEDCGAVNSMVYQEGCLKCSNCGWSKC